MVNFFGAKRYSANNAIYAPQVLNDYVTYKGNPTLSEYWLPNTTNELGYTVVGTLNGIGGIPVTDYTDVNYKALSYSKSDKSNKVNKLWYLNSASDVYSRRFFMLDSNNEIIYDNGEPVLRPRNINSEYKVDVDNVWFTKDTKFNLNQNNYSM